MSRLQITKASHVLKWVSLLCAESNFISSNSGIFYVYGSHHTLQKTRLYGTRSCADLISSLGFAGKGKRARERARAMREEAESALAEYFYFTRNLEFMDAENMSKNAPEFLYSLMKRVEIDDDTINFDDPVMYHDTISCAVTRYLRYHPVNEFEPFFESIGLKYSEYVQLLPKGLMFLVDDELLLKNYYVLCNYGIERNRIGKIFKEANEVFRNDYGALQAKLRSFENLGLKQSLVAKTVASSPHLLNVNVGEFVDFFEKLKKLGIEPDWILEHIRKDGSYNWKSMLQLMCFLCKSGWSEKQVGDLFKQHPHLLLECSGHVSFCLIGILLKFGSTMSDVQSLFLQFPHMPVSKFYYNLHNSYNFLDEIGIPALDIGQIVRSYPVLLGSLELKKVNSILQSLKIWWCGKKRLCQMVKDDPFTLEGWVRGRKLEPLNNTPNRGVVVMAMKTQFLISLGFEESSKEMERALRKIGCKIEDLQQRFDFLVKNGLSREEVIKMVKVCPQILCLTSNVIEAKIRVFVDDFGYGVSDLVDHPRVLCHGIKKLRVRLLMYKTLKDQGAVRPGLTLDYVLSVPEKDFKRRCQMVKDDPFTLEWVRYKKPIRMALKTQFLISLGFEESSTDMEKALKMIRGKGQDLQQRFDCLVKNGLSREEVIKMVNVSPQILNRTTDVIEAKIRFFCDDLGYGVSDLLAHPKILCYTIKRLKLRVLMYEWLKAQGASRPDLSFSTLLCYSDKKFISNHVNRHARGPDFWKNLKQETYLD